MTRTNESRNVPRPSTWVRRTLAAVPDLVGVVLFTGSLLMVSAFIATMS
jgi:hypothetical protein